MHQVTDTNLGREGEEGERGTERGRERGREIYISKINVDNSLVSNYACTTSLRRNIHLNELQ